MKGVLKVAPRNSARKPISHVESKPDAIRRTDKTNLVAQSAQKTTLQNGKGVKRTIQEEISEEEDVSEEEFYSSDEISDVDIADLLNADSSEDDQSLSEDIESPVPEDPVAKEIEVNYYDTSDEEFLNDTVGKISLEWYNNHPHIGYDIDGNKILKPATPDQLERLLNRLDKGSRTIYDDAHGTSIELTDEQIAVVQNMVSGKFPDTDYDPYTPTIEWFTQDKMQTPLTGKPEPKSRFIPSKSEHKLIMRLVRAIRSGRIQVNQEQKPAPNHGPWSQNFFSIWQDHTDEAGPADHHVVRRIQAPKVALPDTSESYNPPEEYLPTEEEKAKWLTSHPDDRERSYLPQKFQSLRQVPAYPKFMNDRFERCLDLYLCPRMIRMRMNVDPDSLLPSLPNPQSLLPFPMDISIRYPGHSAKKPVRCLSIDATGKYLATAQDDAIRIFEITTARCMITIPLKDEQNRVYAIAFNPNPAYSSVIAICHHSTMDIIHLQDLSLDKDVIQLWFDTGRNGQQGIPLIPWEYHQIKSNNQLSYSSISLKHTHPVTSMTWHRRGDYLSTVSPDAGNQAVVIHQISKGTTYAPFKKLQGTPQCVLFHPSQPMIFVATQRFVRGYNLQDNQSLPKLNAGVQQISTLAIHPNGDHLLIGSHDRKVCWFDMEISTKAYKTLKYHKMSVRQVTFHKKYPLFGSCSDDGSVHIFHGKVFSDDLTKNPFIVPVKILRDAASQQTGITDCQFHPNQPWIFTSNQHGQVLLYT